MFRCLTDNGSNMVKAFNLLSKEAEEESSDVSDELDDESGHDSNTELEDDQTHQRYIDDEIRVFEEFENDNSSAFSWKRNGCFVYTLQLVVNEFEKAPCFKSTLTKARKIV